MELINEIKDIFDKLGNSMLAWAKDIITFFDTNLSKKLTASISWSFFNKQVSRKVDKFYDLIQDAVDNTEVVLFEHNQTVITEDLKKAIKSEIEPKLKTYQEIGADFIKKYEAYASYLDEDIWVELKDIVFNITIENIINIIEEKFHE